jgi:hypothetical protein
MIDCITDRPATLYVPSVSENAGCTSDIKSRIENRTLVIRLDPSIIPFKYTHSHGLRGPAPVISEPPLPAIPEKPVGNFGKKKEHLSWIPEHFIIYLICKIICGHVKQPVYA